MIGRDARSNFGVQLPVHTLDVLIIADFHFVIVSKPTNIITRESPCKVGALPTVKAHLLSLIYRTHQWLEGAWWPSIETVQWPTWRAGEPTSTTALLHPPPPHPVFHIPYYPCTILLLYLYYPSTYVFAYPPSILFLLLLYCPGAYFQLDYADSRAYIHPKFAPICLHFRPCLTLICMLYACYSGFRALYSGWFTPRYILCLF